MKYQVTNRKLIVILNELAEEYKDNLLEATLSSKNEVDIENISISDLIRIDIEIKDHLKNRNRKKKVHKISTSITLLGLIYALLGLMLTIVSDNNSHITDSSLHTVAFVCIFAGFIVAVIGLMIGILLRTQKIQGKQINSSDYEITIINTWRTIESLVYQISPHNDKLSLKSMLNNLEQSNLISKEELKTLNQLLLYRNKILHNAPGRISHSQEIHTLLTSAHAIISKLSNMV